MAGDHLVVDQGVKNPLVVYADSTDAAFAFPNVTIMGAQATVDSAIGHGLIEEGFLVRVHYRPPSKPPIAPDR
jgi:hypothetical protein